MHLTTSRLLLRPWRETDAPMLYAYAQHPLVGPAAGWPVHTSVENSLEIIRDVLSADETYAVTIQGEDVAIGSVGLLPGAQSNLGISADEAELGYWIAVPFWGQGLIPEAARELMRHGFDDLGLETLWCGYFDGNEKSRRVIEKCGFRYHSTKQVDWPLLGERKTQHVSRISKDEWRARCAE